MKFPAALLALVLPILLMLGEVQAQEACFPNCREGYVCSPEGQCVSACNPACDDGQRCFDGDCYAKVEDKAAEVDGVAAIKPPEVQQSSVVQNASALRLVAGVSYQFLDTEEDTVVTATAVQLAALIFPVQWPLFLRPRVVVALGEENYYEPSIDLGYEFRWQGSRMNFSMQTALVIGLWPNFAGVDEYGDGEVEPIGPYFGLAIGPTIHFGKASLGLHLERGYQLSSDPDTRVSTMGFMAGYAL